MGQDVGDSDMEQSMNCLMTLLTLYSISQKGIWAQVELDHKRQYLKIKENNNG